MSIYIKYLTFNYLKSFFFVFFVMLCLVIILNILTEIEFFKDYKVSSYLPLYLAILNTFDLIFDMFPFIFLITTQVFFVNLFTDNQINIFKYSGLKNIKIISILSILTFFIGILIITLFYSFSSKLKNLYLESKNFYSSDNKYLAVVTNNGLWIKDKIDEKILIINANEIQNNFLKKVNISEFDAEFKLLRIINSEKIDIKSKDWILHNSQIIKSDFSEKVDYISMISNFDYDRINNLFSNLSSLSILELFELRNNYKQINYSTVEIDVQLQKLLSFPVYFSLMTILSALIMFNTKRFKSTSFKIVLGLFSCVVIYYINSLFQVLGETEKISLLVSVWLTLIILTIFNLIFVIKINEK